METHWVNLFEITNLKDLKCSYQLLEIQGLDGQGEGGERKEKNLGVLVKRIAFTERLPAALVHREGKEFITIPADSQLQVLEYGLTPDVATLVPVADKYPLDLSNLFGESHKIALSFLTFNFKGPLMRNEDLWASGSSAFFWKRPINWRDDSRDIDVYGGFGFKLVFTKGKICLAVRLAYKYVDRRWLTDLSRNGDMNEYRNRRMLYHFGNAWYPVRFMGVTGRSLVEQKFQITPATSPTNVYEYTINKNGKNAPPWITTLDQNSPAIHYKYLGSEKPAFGAASLCKLIYATDDSGAKNIHRVSIRPPERWLRDTESVVERYFQSATFRNTPIRLSRHHLEVPKRVFPVPDLIFGQDKVLHVSQGGGDEGVALNKLGETRMAYLLDNGIGPVISSGFHPQYLFAPEGLARTIVEGFADRFKKTMQQFAHSNYSIDLVLYKDQGRTLKEQIDSIMDARQRKQIRHGYAVLILPRTAHPSLHNYLKRKLNPELQIQCVTAQNLERFYMTFIDKGQLTCKVRDELAGRYTSYLRYTALGHLLVNRKWLWSIRNPLHYGLYIGIDVLNHTAAFTFLYEGGHRCYVYSHSSQQKEKLSARQMREVIYQHIKEDLADQTLRSIVIHRDGQTYLQEWRGFQEGIGKLQGEGILASNVNLGIVEIHKHSSLGMRMITRRHDRFVNPRIGSWFPLDELEGVVCTTGYPYHFDGTVNPLHVKIAFGDLVLERALQDVFSLTHLCWMVPDRCCRYPITTKLSHDFLAVAADADEDSAQYGEDSSFEEQSGEFNDAVSA